MIDVLAGLLLLAGALLTFAAGMGALRFADVLSRLHAAAKPQVMGLILVMLGLALRLREPYAVWMLVLVALFQMLTSPVNAHMVARAGYRTGKVPHDRLVVDELTRDLEAADAAARAEERAEEHAAAQGADQADDQDATRP